MKKLLILPLLFLSFLSFAQKFYVGVDGAWMLPVVPEAITENYNSQSGPTTNTSTNEAVKGSFTSGFSTGGFLGYVLNENISFEAGMNYLFANQYSGSQNYVSTNSSDNYSNKLKLNLINFYPAIKFSVPNETITPYIRTGILYGITSLSNDETQTHLGSSQPQTIEQTYMLTGNSWGLFTSIGIEKNLNARFKFFAEWTFRFQSFSPKKETLTRHLTNGADDLSSMPLSQTETDFVDSYTNSGTSDPTKPQQALGFARTFNSMGLQAGIIYVIGGNNFATKKLDPK